LQSRAPDVITATNSIDDRSTATVDTYGLTQAEALKFAAVIEHAVLTLVKGVKYLIWGEVIIVVLVTLVLMLGGIVLQDRIAAMHLGMLRRMRLRRSKYATSENSNAIHPR
jgi:hypothetical protein